MGNLKNLAIALFIGIIAGGILTKHFFPNVETKEVEKEVIKKDIVTITKEVIRPDGTKEVVTTTTDKSTEKKDKTIVQYDKKEYHISASVSRQSLTSKDVYGIQVEKKVFGDMTVGARIDTEKNIGVVVGISF